MERAAIRPSPFLRLTIPEIHRSRRQIPPSIFSTVVTYKNLLAKYLALVFIGEDVRATLALHWPPRIIRSPAIIGHPEVAICVWNEFSDFENRRFGVVIVEMIRR